MKFLSTQQAHFSVYYKLRVFQWMATNSTTPLFHAKNCYKYTNTFRLCAIETSREPIKWKERRQGCLKKRNKRIVGMRFGLSGIEPNTKHCFVARILRVLFDNEFVLPFLIGFYIVVTTINDVFEQDRMNRCLNHFFFFFVFLYNFTFMQRHTEQ